MKIAVYYPDKFPAFSIKIYTDILIEELSKMGVEFVKFTDFNAVNQEVDIIWDTQTGGGNPTFLDKKYDVPTVITMHGSALFSLPIKDNIVKKKTILRILQKRYIYKNKWKQKSKYVDKVIAVSEYCKDETIKYLPFNKKQITSIYHGVDFNFYKQNEDKKTFETKIFLHISQFQPKKNISRIIEAFKIANNKIPNIKLKIICPGYSDSQNHKNIEIINTYAERDEIIKLYHNSYAFIFPSLHETFGLPILEAMASGLPVITSKTTACGEIAGSKAILVNPYSISDIADAIIQISENKILHEQLSVNAKKYSKNFTWQKSANKHLELFRSLIHT